MEVYLIHLRRDFFIPIRGVGRWTAPLELIPVEMRSTTGMHIAGLRPGRTEGEAELIGNLSLVGSRGRFCAILTERQLTLERFDGYGIRMDLESISKMRHMKIPNLPGGTPIIGAVAMGVGYSVLLPPVGWAVFVAGGISIMSYLSLRKSTLVIENGDERHMIGGSDGALMRLCLMVDRIRSGDSVADARVGLEDIETELPIFPAYMDAGGTAPPMMALPMPAPPPLGDLPPPELNVGIEEPMQTKIEDESEFSWRSFQEEPVPPKEMPNFETSEPEKPLSAYERAWGRQESPDWYREKDPASQTESRIESALSGAADMFGFGGMFDDDDGPVHSSPLEEEGSIFGGIFDESSESVSRVSSSSEMIKAAHNRFGEPIAPYNPHALPEPTVEAVREECKPGLVRMAKARQAQTRKALAAPSIDNASLDDYPGVSKLATSMNGGRVDTRGIARSRSKPSWIVSLLRPKSRASRKERGDYSSQYGDSDGVEHSEGEKFRTSQILRLRSDQDHQADVVGRMDSRRALTPPSSAKDALNRKVRKVLEGEEGGPASLSETGSGLRFSQLRRSSPSSEKHHIPGVRRLE